MVKITHKGSNLEKIEHILVAAQKRFGMYGLEKVTMKEIASDLNMTKGSLYYYFPDKEHLYMAVIQKEFDEFLDLVRGKIEELDDPAEMLQVFVNIRLYYFRNFLNLSRFRLDGLNALRPVMEAFWVQTRNDESALIASILQKGVDMNIFKVDDISETAFLFMDLLKGLRFLLMRNKQLFYLEEDEFEILLTRTKKFAGLFIRGISIAKR
jgi:TetR/AcrR family transcriptional regulator